MGDRQYKVVRNAKTFIESNGDLRVVIKNYKDKLKEIEDANNQKSNDKEEARTVTGSSKRRKAKATKK
jgi:hypothetical protein